MLPILAITLPIFLIIGGGYLATRAGLFSLDQVRAMSRFVLNFAMPALIFRSLSQQRIAEVFDARYLVVYGLGSLAMLLGGFAWFRFARGHGATRSSLRGLGMATANTAFIGYPVAAQFLGPVAGLGLALTLVVENLLILPLAIAMAEAGRAGHGRPAAIAGDIGRGLARSPLVVALAAGGSFALLGLSLPAPLGRAVAMLADASAPVALFAIGGSLVGLTVKGIAGEIALVTAGKLLLHPLAILAVMQLLPIANPDLRRAAIVFACIPMPTIYAMLGHKYGEERFCAAALLAATTASFLTITLVLWLVESGIAA